MNDEVRICNTCNVERPIRFFHKQGDSRRGKCSICYSTYRREMGWERKRYERKSQIAMRDKSNEMTGCCIIKRTNARQ